LPSDLSSLSKELKIVYDSLGNLATVTYPSPC
jgi:hypothetical protein